MNAFPGSKWWKVDFHAHTPASVCYGKNHPDEKALKSYPLKDWLLDYMKAGIDCVAVTDHNTGAAIDDIKEAYEDLVERKPAGFRELVIFPGVEITALGNVHILGIFPEQTTSEEINTVVDNCEYDGAKGASNDCTNKPPSEVVDRIARKGGLAIPAHVEAERGIFGALQGATLNKVLESENIIAMECSTDWEPPQSYTGKKLNWACVTGSDQHHPTGDPGQKYPGSHFTWVKMETPCWEELRQALLAHEVCVLDQTEEDPNKTPDIFLRSLTIEEMCHCGAKPSPPLRIEFNPFFNAIIGGRGTGKSTALESIRIAARRHEQLDKGNMPKLAQDLKEFMQPSTRNGVMKPDTELTLEIFRRGVDYRLTWNQGHGYLLQVFADGEWNESHVEGDILDRFPMDIFSQKQIYTLASAPQGLLAIIDRAPDIDKQDWQNRWDAKRSEYRQMKEAQRRLLAQTENEGTVNAKLVDIRNDMTTYEKQGHGKTLTEYQYRKRQKQSIPLIDDFDKLASRVQSLAENIRITSIPEGIFKEDDPFNSEVGAIQSTLLSELSSIRAELQDASKRIEAVTENRKQSLLTSKWYAAVKDAEAEYEKLQAEYVGKDLHLEDYNKWVKQRGDCEKELLQIAKHKDDSEKLQAKIDKCMQELIELRTELFNKRNIFLAKTLEGNQYVKMELVPYGDASEIEANYRDLFSLGSSYEGALYDVEAKRGLLWELINWEDADPSGSAIPTLLEHVREGTTHMIQTGEKVPGKEYMDGRLPGNLRAKYETNPACLDSLYTWWPEDLLKVRHGDPSRKEFKELEKGSAGQKAAAMLAFLLSHGTTPLIIDQPEDDLDSELIYSLIVQQIVDKKRQRQLILVTHNANIVVNGDAEYVHVLKFGKGQIRSDAKGGLGKPAIRKKICNVMEGGEIAFKKRYNRIIHDK